MTISTPSQVSLWTDSDASTSSPEATLASHSVLPGSDEARRMTATSGRTCAVLLTQHDRVSCWLKTLLGTSRWASTLFWLTWKPTATPAGRLLFRLVPSTRYTAGTGSGLWPTATVAMRDNRSPHGKQEVRPSLESAARAHPRSASIPTPTVQDGKNNAGPSQHERNTPPLNTWVVQNPWPTPRHEGFDAGAHRGRPDSLHSAVKAWPTPRASESEMRTYKRPASHENGTHGKHLQVEALRDHGTTDGSLKLHGRWTLALMGFPPTWCDDLPDDSLIPT